MLAESQPANSGTADGPKLRAACENCRQSKVKCNLGGKNTCIRCLRHGLPCRYRVANRSGKPKGSKNRATLRKLGQLSDEKASSQDSARRETKERAVDVVGPDEPYEVDRSFEYQTSEPTLSESPPHAQQDSHSAINACMLTTDTPLDYASTYGTPAFAAGVFPFTMHIPDALQPPGCECDETLAFQMSGLRHMVADTGQLRFDQSLQAIKTALTGCQSFLHCTGCAKANTTILVAVSTLDLVLQLFDYWMSYEFAGPATATVPAPAPATEPVAYGVYETEPEETRPIRRVVLRGRLVQCKEVLGLLHEAVDVTEASSSTGGGGGSNGLEGSWLQQIIRGYASTAESFLQPLVGCICGR
ncbi:hypothetical protein BDV59DRAFT_198417 [Aspergillus ambiguus]|uniref:Zn(II)2Cys6 transcription factor domain-containing protein n=1 Tax=Aspergillus ambiguus TaxID=176160 RepID=UPI003CCD37E3